MANRPLESATTTELSVVSSICDAAISDFHDLAPQRSLASLQPRSAMTSMTPNESDVDFWVAIRGLFMFAKNKVHLWAVGALAVVTAILWIDARRD